MFFQLHWYLSLSLWPPPGLLHAASEHPQQQRSSLWAQLCVWQTPKIIPPRALQTELTFNFLNPNEPKTRKSILFLRNWRSYREHAVLCFLLLYKQCNWYKHCRCYYVNVLMCTYVRIRQSGTSRNRLPFLLSLYQETRSLHPRNVCQALSSMPHLTCWHHKMVSLHLLSLEQLALVIMSCCCGGQVPDAAKWPTTHRHLTTMPCLILCSLQSNKDIDALAASTPIVISHQREVDLSLHLARFPEAVEDMLQELAPNRWGVQWGACFGQN